MGIEKAGIIGAGMMGAEIAVCFAMAGTDVILKDANMELAQAGKDRLGSVLDKAIKKDISHRFQTAADFRDRLEKVVSNL